MDPPSEKTLETLTRNDQTGIKELEPPLAADEDLTNFNEDAFVTQLQIEFD